MLHERLRNHRIVARLEPPRTVAALPVGPTADREARYERDRDDDREPGEHRGDDAVREAHTRPLGAELGHAAAAALSPGLRVHVTSFLCQVAQKRKSKFRNSLNMATSHGTLNGRPL